jgi:Putative cyclase
MWKRVQTRRGQLALFAALTLGLVGVAGSVPAQPAPSPGSLAEAYRIIASRQFVDLTHAFSPASPVWRGFGPAIMSAAAVPRTQEPYTIARHGFRATIYSMVGQYGTHIDPPAHFDSILNGRQPDDFGLPTLMAAPPADWSDQRAALKEEGRTGVGRGAY